MSVNNINSTSYAAYASYQAKTSEASVNVSTKDGTSVTVKKTDTFVRSQQFAVSAESESAAKDTSVKGLATDQIDELKNQQAESMKNMVKQMLGEQIKSATGLDLFEAFGTKNIDSILADLPEIATTPEAAAEAISEDGAWGVDAVSTRLVDMAVSLSGGDSAKAAELREAVQKGFDEVREMFGGALPQVCEDTYTETMKRFDYWEENGSMDGYEMSGGSDEE